MKSFLCALVLSALLGAAAGASAGEPVPAPQLLPDLRPLPPRDLAIDAKGKETFLRFDTDVLNRGSGPLELKPVDVDQQEEDCDGNGDPADDVGAEQHVYADTTADGEFVRDDDLATPRWAGCQHFHVLHNHWHFDDFGVYKLFKIRKNNGLRLKVVARSDKVTFCMVDTFPRLDKPGTPEHKYYPRNPNGTQAFTCTEHATTGISVGYVDNYAKNLAGQELPITGLREGAYCLRIRTDPRNKLQESNESNNRNSLKLRLIETSDGFELGVARKTWCPR